ncbi:MAG: YCF48-related protein, partial [Melioribacteraceae bacterium]
PFNFETEYEIMEAQIKKKPTRIGDIISNTPDILDKIILKMMEKNPNARYLDCEDVQNDLAELEKNVSKLQTSYFQKRVNTSPRIKAYSILAFSGMLLFLLALSWFVYNQVDGLLKSNQLEKFKKYSVESLFAEDSDSLFNKKVQRLNSGVKTNFNSIVFADSKTSFAVGDSGSVVVSRDSGKTWLGANINSKVLLNDVFSFRSGKCFIVGDSATLLMSQDNLNSFIDVPTMQMRNGITFFNIYFKNESLGFITGNNGIILKTMNGGMNWKQVITNTDNLLYDIVFTDNKSGFAVGWEGTLLKTTDSGETWIKVDSNSDTYLKSIDFNMNGYGIIVGGNGTMLRTTDYGRNWKKQNINIQGGFQKVKFIKENYVIALGIRGAILISNDSGESWKQLKTKVYNNLNSLAISPNGDVFIAGINGTIIKLL